MQTGGCSEVGEHGETENRRWVYCVSGDDKAFTEDVGTEGKSGISTIFEAVTVKFRNRTLIGLPI